MKRLVLLGLVLALVSFSAMSVPLVSTVQAANHQTFTVNVGYENATNGTLIEAYFPDTVYIHVGDTIHWVQKTHEIHTVTFLYGTLPPVLDLIIPAPNTAPSPLQLNPADVFPTVPAGGMYDGTTFANSGIMSLDPGNPTSFNLTFTRTGTFSYSCLVHGTIMSGKVVVLPAARKIPSPAQDTWYGNAQLGQKLSKVQDVVEAAFEHVTKPSRNPDGSTTYHVLVGFGMGQIDLVRFFPSKLNVRQGDTVVWNVPAAMPNMTMPPHTVSFLNGTADQPLVVPFPQTPPAPPLLLFNPAILFPTGTSVLTRNGFINSGVLSNVPGPSSFTLKVGAISGLISYECLLHDGSGMVATLNVIP